MDAAEFDTFAEAYIATHQANIRISGETPDYFARSKVQTVRRRWDRRGGGEPEAILDFGAGIGNAWPWLAAAFPSARLVGLDVSGKSLDVATRRFPGAAEAMLYDGRDIPLEPGRFDLIFSACVFHHIPVEEHVALFAQLRRLLRPGGLMTIFEHNPVNPVTRYIVATCPFDERAVLIPAGVLKRRQLQAGFKRVELAYTGFFPHALAVLRPMEQLMSAAPFGAQYVTTAQA